jgi:hypothetical protein
MGKAAKAAKPGKRGSGVAPEEKKRTGAAAKIGEKVLFGGKSPITEKAAAAFDAHAFQATPVERQLVMLAVACGFTQEQICRLIRLPDGISKPTLRKHFRDELDHGADVVTMKVATNVFKIATDPNHKQGFNAARFWLMARSGWAVPKGGEPLPPPPRVDAHGNPIAVAGGDATLPGTLDGMPVEFTLVIGDRDPSATDDLAP